MKTRTFTRLLVLLLAVILGLSGLAAGGAVTAQAAEGDTLSSYMISVKWPGWDSGREMTFMSGYTHDIMTSWNVHCSWDNADVANCKACYCIEPGVHAASGKDYTEKDEGWFDTKVDNDAFNSTIDGRTVRSHLGRIMQYGYTGGVDSHWGTNPNAYKSEICQYIATQILIWQVIVGERDENFGYVFPPAGCNEVDDLIEGHPWESEIWDCYREIAESVISHVGKPSFMADKASNAETVALKWDGSKYTATLTDTNGVLDNFSFSASGGVTCSVSGNELTLSSATAPSGPVTITATKTMKRKGLVVWYRDDYQKKISYTQEVDDPLWGYVKVEAEQRGKAQIVKNTTNGGDKSGWHFTVTDSCGNTVGTYVTDASGLITLDLEPGTYTVTETDGPYDYWINDPEPTKTVTVTAGQTATVTFTNRYLGKAQIVKNTTNGGSKAGWNFTVKNSDGSTVGTYTTDASGVITLDLEPGTYTVTETDGAYDYWVNDPQRTKTVTVQAGQTATVTFLNKWNGRAKIIKTLANPEAGSLEGWSFTVTGSSGAVGTYITNASGEIVLDLEPGTYTVTENIPENSIWECQEGVTRAVTVKAGETAVVTFTNALRPGEIHICKVDTQGAPLDGVEFLLEWSEDGSTWQPVTRTDSAVPQIGGCTTEGLVDGRLVSDENGVVTFSGLYPTLQYRLTETATQDGYQLLTGPAYEGKLPADDDLSIAIKVVNAEIFTLPQTGAKSMTLLPLAIFLCLGIFIIAIVSIQRKEA